jgi:Zn-dependent membrane protease YugP
MLKENQMLGEDEIKGARRVLSAAAMTYVAASLMAFLNLLRLIAIRDSRS